MIPLSQLAKENAGLLRQLRHLSFPDMARLGAAMLAMPEFQANSVRLEALVHLAAIGCEGNDLANHSHLQKSLNNLGPQSLAQQEDPPSDVFMGCVNSHAGSFRLILGTYNDGDFWVERLCNFLLAKQNFPPFQPVIEAALSLLGLSEALANRLGLERYASGSGDDKKPITAPRWRDLHPVSEALYFSLEELAELGIPENGLEQFVFDTATRSTLLQQTLWSSTLEARPLLRLEKGILIIAPSSFGRTIVRYVVDKIHDSGMGGWAQTFYDQEAATEFVNMARSRLKIEGVRFDAPVVPDMVPLFPYFGTFDEGKMAILLTLNPSFMNNSPINMEMIDELPPQGTDKINRYIAQCIKQAEEHPSFSGGMILVCFGGIGRSVALNLHMPPERWSLQYATLAEWNTLLGCNDCTAIRLFKFGEHERVAHSHNVSLTNLWGLVEVYSFWISSGFRLISQNTAIGSSRHMLVADGSFSLQYHQRSRQLLDVHCVPTHDGASKSRLVRFETSPLFKDKSEKHIYGDIEAVGKGILRGCIELKQRRWWVIVKNSAIPNAQRNSVYEFWKCVLNWTSRLSEVAETIFPALPEDSIAIELDFVDLDNWKAEETNQGLRPIQDITASSSSENRAVTLHIPEGFLSHFNQPKNVAERAIVRVIFEGLCKLCPNVLPEADIETTVNRVVPNEDARHFHVILTQDIRRLLNIPFLREPRFIAEEDLALSQLGLGFLNGAVKPGLIKGKKECQDYLERVVDLLWLRIETKLREFNSLSVATDCLRAIVELEKDKDHWELTARAILALHEDRQDSLAVFVKRNSERALAIITNRLLIEIAQYSGGEDKEKLFNTCDHLSLLADCSNLLWYAQHRDAISYGFMEAVVEVAPNGEPLFNMEFYEGVMRKYITRHSERNAERAAKDYDEYFEPPQASDKSQLEKPLPPELQKMSDAFQAEYGIGLMTYFKIGKELSLLALSEHKDALLFNNLGWTKFLKDRCGIPLEVGRRLLESFQLPLRSAFDKDLPAGCHPSDVFPWRFRRKLSLLGRPLIQIKKPPGPWLTFATSFDTSLKYLIGHIESGAFPQSYFKSQKMRAFQGSVVNKLGHEFTVRVSKVFSDAGFETRTEVEMSNLGAPKHAGLGDVDIVAWNPATGVVYLVECKRLRPAFTVREVVQRLEEFKGDQKELDALGRHTRRITWLTSNQSGLSKITGIPIGQMVLRSRLVTSDIVPMQFFQNLKFPSNQVISFENLSEYLAK